MRRDVLAAGASKATFAGGMGDTDFTRNVMSDEDRVLLEQEAVVEVTAKAVTRKQFRPLGKVLLVRRKVADELSNVIITETMEKDAPAEGSVLAIGSGVDTLKVGEDVAFGKYAGTEYRLNGETLLLMELSDVMGVIEDEPDSQ